MSSSSGTRRLLDPRLRILIENNVKKNHRSFIVLVGDRGRDRIPGLYYLLTHARDKLNSKRSVLWCYKKELGFSSHRKKREQKARMNQKLGKPNDDEFDLFINSAEIRYTYYKESHKILGQTFEMCILQDFEAITPNLLAQTIETVEGGGLIILMLKTMTSLKQLYTMTMDVHSRYRSSSGDSVVARFNERFILSLAACDDCLVLDDELNVLPISRGKDITPLEEDELRSGEGKAAAKQLQELKDSLQNDRLKQDLVNLTRTIDQAQAVLTFIDALQEKTLSSTVSLTAARGRGKSAALGLAVSSAIVHGYSNIFITSPSPENLKTFWQFVGDGLKALGYVINVDYDAMESVSPEVGKGVIVRVNVWKTHRQTIQWIQPQDAHVLGQAELVIIDEAAAIPLPLVKNLMGPYLVFMASTINGYEGTGRSLSLKLLQQLRESTRPSLTKAPAADESAALTSLSGTHSSKRAGAGLGGVATKARTLKEIQLQTPIRYSSGDKIERWLNGLLCLDASTLPRSTIYSGSPKECQLFSVSRDTLFSFHPASELFLQRMVALYVASHYKNQPNDLQLMSDAPQHRLFVLLPPIADDETVLPDPIAVVQVVMEGSISKEAILDSISRGLRAGGDMIPWTVSQQFQENKFAQLSGARVVRIAVHPDYTRMGFGARALEALNDFYSGEYFNLDETPRAQNSVSFEKAARVGKSTTLQEETLGLRDVTTMPPLLQRLSEIQPPALDYLGVAYGLTAPLLKFWKRAGYIPLYLRQTPSDLTGEFTCMMVRGVGKGDGPGKSPPIDWLTEFAKDFRSRFLSLLSYRFREFGSILGLQVLEAVNGGARDSAGQELGAPELGVFITAFDIKRLEAYSNNMIDYHVILDLLPTLATLYFKRRLIAPKSSSADTNAEEATKERSVKLSAIQSALLLAMGLQRKTIEEVGEEVGLEPNQVLAQLLKVIKKICSVLQLIQREDVVSGLPAIAKLSVQDEAALDGGGSSAFAARMNEELEEAAEQVRRELRAQGEEDDTVMADGEEENEKRARQKEFINSLDLSQYTIGDSIDLSSAQAQVSKLSKEKKGAVSSIFSVKSNAPPPKRKAEALDESSVNKAKKTRRGSGKKQK
ncbi:related to KRE33-Killer toxin REsistant protein [Serendipita indica DSM 11827]|uniref:RNA cytidine acetyltransferase n=1 Tax=Serendipita indica (strain DSM 11827) TaxID=1109443 RepID=G4TFH1_SERID|nr:related to KRE33-Killer toxin REsistant protein [Serendipita indica DSM 11827]